MTMSRAKLLKPAFAVQVAPSIAMVRFSYEILLQSMGVGGMEVYRHAGKSDTALP